MPANAEDIAHVPGSASSDSAQVTTLLNKLYTCDTTDDCVGIATELANLLRTLNTSALEDVLKNLTAAAQNKKDGLAREGGLIGLAGICSIVGSPSEPYMMPLLPLFLDLYADKGPPVRNAASMAAYSLLNMSSPMAAVPVVLPMLFDGLSKKWVVQVGALELLAKLAAVAPAQIGEALPDIIPRVTNCMHDTKSEVSVAASQAMTEVCSVNGNPDIMPHVPLLVRCMAHPDEVPACVQKLAMTTFVAEVTGPALAIMVPLLVRALTERSPGVLRSAAIIIDNLCKLVRDPADAAQFLPQLLPGLDRLIDSAAFPEIRALATTARATLAKAGGAAEANGTVAGPLATEQDVLVELNKLIPAQAVTPFMATAVKYVSGLCASLVQHEYLGRSDWKKGCTVYLGGFLEPDAAEAITKTLLHHYVELDKKRRGEEDEVDDGSEELCNCDFSLAYGTMMLLNHTSLRLHRGHRYGLCGPNGAGKSTLMRAISRGQVEGFPSANELRTVFVEHSLQGEDGSLSVMKFIATDEKLKDVTEEKIRSALTSVGFTDERQAQAVGSLSGGWKMKLELARAMLLNADILLLDEPTNHLDVANVAWLERYLVDNPRITCIIVSHDSGFLDNVCTDIIHYERKKLVYYKGNLSEFVKKKPEAKAYYTLSADLLKFKFPAPGFLTGIKSNTKAIIRITKASYTYPGSAKPSMNDASVTLSLSSRVGIIGANGAGKSTLIKLLTGEVIPTEGSVWKHPNLRIGYVAQHAFHHLDQHLDKTPNQYIRWRYQHGEDREVLEKATRKLSDEDRKQLDRLIDVKNEKRKVEYLIGRQKLKKSFQYEIKWVGKEHKHNTWMPREELLELGFQKLVQAYDDREASREGQAYRDLTPQAVRAHIEDLGLDGDIADHNLVGSLSGGQKVKVVIAAAMWNNPHMLVLDEPTNFLDRDALGGLAVAIRDWDGAVVMISHNAEFVSALCPEIWNVEAGRIINKGKVAIADDKFDDRAATPTAELDISTNGKTEEDSTNVQEEQAAVEKAVEARQMKKKKLTRKQLKEQEVRRRLRHLNWLTYGGPRPVDTDSE